MKSIKQFFHILSYLQYPLYLVAMFFAIKPYLNGIDYVIDHIDVLVTNISYFFIFLGLGISLSSLQDNQKIQLKFEKAAIEDPKKAKIFLMIISGCTILMLLFGVLGYFLVDNKAVNEISLGILILGVGFISLLKTQLELAEESVGKPILERPATKTIESSPEEAD